MKFVVVQLSSFLQGQKNDFRELEYLYLAIHPVEIFEIFTTSSQTSVQQDPMVTCPKMLVFFLNLILVLEIVVLERF